MPYRLFLDDERYPPDNGPWTVIRSVSEFKQIITVLGPPSFISFDHDLGDDVPTGMDAVKWLIETDIDSGGTFLPKNFNFTVHSMNPVGAQNIKSILTNYLEFRAS